MSGPTTEKPEAGKRGNNQPSRCSDKQPRTFVCRGRGRCRARLSRSGCGARRRSRSTGGKRCRFDWRRSGNWWDRRRGFNDRTPAGFCIPLQPLKISSHVGGVLITKIAVLLQRLTDYLFQLRRKIRIKPHRRDRRFAQNRLENRCRAVAAKRERACGHFVKKDRKSTRLNSSH